jgi:hypothetical protein
MRIIYYFAFLLILLNNVASVAGTVKFEELQSEPGNFFQNFLIFIIKNFKAKECSVHDEGITPICVLLGEDCMNEVKQKEDETHKKLQKCITSAKSGLKEKIGETFNEISENADNSLLDVKTFREWIKSAENVTALVDVSEKPQIYKLFTLKISGILIEF